VSTRHDPFSVVVRFGQRAPGQPTELDNFFNNHPES
jgi:hypothetical protein